MASAFSSKPRSSIEIDPLVGKAWTLPADVYLDAAQLEREKQALFGKTWQILGRRDQVSKAGEYFTAELTGDPLLTRRGSDGVLRGFYNVCRHRAGPPAEGCGSRKVFRCGYHGWTYGLDGRLISSPEFEGVADFHPQEFGLRPVRTEEWAGLVFVNLDNKAEPLLESFGDFSQ